MQYNLGSSLTKRYSFNFFPFKDLISDAIAGLTLAQMAEQRGRIIESLLAEPCGVRTGANLVHPDREIAAGRPFWGWQLISA